MQIVIASDHAGYNLKSEIVDAMASEYKINDLGTNSQESVDYPLIAKELSEFMSHNEDFTGILICGSGQGVAMAANKFDHVRAALCRNEEDAKMARAHNDANVIVLGGRVTSEKDAIKIVKTFMSTKFEGGRHERRVNQMSSKSNQFFKTRLKVSDPELSSAINDELHRQQNKIELIASENIVSQAVLDAQGSVLTNKYAEGYPGRRYYGGCEFVDVAENLAIERVKKLFGVEFANVQPHSGSQANLCVYISLLQPGDSTLGMSLDAGGHLSHGAKPNVSGKWFEAHHYAVNRETGFIDLNEVEDLAKKHKPKIIIAGGSAYPRIIDFKAFRAIADSVGAYLLVDMAHFAGLVAGGHFPSPVGHAHIITSTTHKTLRGPRGGMILTNDEELAKKINSSMFPGLQGGPLMHVIAAKAAAFGEALKPEYKAYTKAIIENCQALSSQLQKRGYDIFTGGTDCHLLLVDLRKQKLTGKAAEASLDRAGLTCNKNAIPFDTEKPMITSGIRLGTPAGTTRGFRTAEFTKVADYIADVLDNLQKNHEDNSAIENKVKAQVLELCKKFPIYQ